VIPMEVRVPAAVITAIYRKGSEAWARDKGDFPRFEDEQTSSPDYEAGSPDAVELAVVIFHPLR
jgi:hypothetical protein